jgi:hypothetical protein
MEGVNGDLEILSDSGVHRQILPERSFLMQFSASGNGVSVRLVRCSVLR